MNNKERGHKNEKKIKRFSNLSNSVNNDKLQRYCKDTANSVDSTTLDTSSSQSVSEPVESKPQSKSVPPVSSSSMPIVSEPTKEEPKSEVTAPSSKPSTTGETTITPLSCV